MTIESERQELRTEEPRARARRRQTRGIALTDLLVLIAAVLVSEFGWLGTQAATIDLQFDVGYTKFGAGLVLLWWLALHLGGTRGANVLGSSHEYPRIAQVTVITFGLVAMVSLLLKFNLSRGYVAIAFPLGLVGLLLSRHWWRRWRERRYRAGDLVRKVLVVGRWESAAELTRHFARNRGAGLQVTGVWVPTSSHERRSLQVGDRRIAVLGSDEPLESALGLSAADVVIVCDSDALGHRGLRELTWDLEAAGIELLLSPNLLAVAGSRLGMRSVAGVPFVHVKEPQYAEAGNWPKLLFDRLGAAVLLTLSSPVFLATAIAIKLGSPGPVFYRQERIGRDGEPFSVVKFRSMRERADDELTGLLQAQGRDAAPLFKVEDDPRITSVGRLLRRYSIDELPQLVNVIRGEMSLVGPRPQREEEVALYDDSDWRRLRVRPGMTGLWQVSGRSNVGWEEAIQLDMYYVENWSLLGDLQILSRTVRAVLARDGAV